jgi:hypothetical protein
VAATTVIASAAQGVAAPAVVVSFFKMCKASFSLRGENYTKHYRRDPKEQGNNNKEQHDQLRRKKEGEAPNHT